MKDVKKLLKYIGISIGTLLIFVALVGIGSIFEDNWRARAMEKWIVTIDHPGESHHLKSMSLVANFGQSNHCDFAGGEIRASSLSRKEINRFYEPLMIATYKIPNKSFEVYFPDADESYSAVSVFLDELRRLEKDATSTETTYLVLAIDAMHPAGIDIRCH